FTLLVLIVWLLRTRSTFAPLVAGVVGGIVDLVAAERVGPGIAAGALAGYLVPRLAAKLPTRNLLVEAAAVGGGTFGVGLILCGAAFLAAELPQGITAASAHLLGTAAYTAAAAIPFLLLRNWLWGSSLRPSWHLAS
ncbi:MAG: hypothetical protein JNG90_08195, partial [Planctomycetaceae bacterium]|nr:hypothetical protein [Planctomycetaceae bacterium]